MVVSTVTRKGKCEVCEVEAVLYCGTGNIWMCKEHKAEDDALTTANAKVVVAASHKIDTLVVLKADIFNSATTSFNTLQGAIFADDTIPVERKAIAMLDEVAARIKVLDAAIFADKAALAAKESERFSLLKNAQELSSKLRESEKAKYKQYDVNYVPPVTKVGRPKSTSTNKTKTAAFNLKECKAAAEAAGVSMHAVRSRMLARNLSAEAAAKEVAQIAFGD